MAEKSILWSTGATGDGAAAYTQAELFSWVSRSFLGDATKQGVMIAYGNAFAILSGAASPVQVATGAAVVNGIPYINDATKSIAVTTPVSGTTGKAVVLHADYTAQTVRCIINSSADGTAAIPALTQNASIWEIYLWKFTITTGGVISAFTDFRKYIDSGNNIVLNHSSPAGSAPAQTFYGFLNFSNGVTAVTFPTPFSTTPALVFTPVNGGTVTLTALSSTGFTINNATGGAINLSYIAIGTY